MEIAAQKLLVLGCRAVLMKGGHLEGKEMADILFTHDEAPLRLAVPTIQTQNTHGTGCTLSSAIAAYMALGKELPDAVRAAKDYITASFHICLMKGCNIFTCVNRIAKQMNCASCWIGFRISTIRKSCFMTVSTWQ